MLFQIYSYLILLQIPQIVKKKCMHYIISSINMVVFLRGKGLIKHRVLEVYCHQQYDY